MNDALIEATADKLDILADVLSEEDRRLLARAALAVIAPAVLEDAAGEVAQWFPHGTIDNPKYAAGRALFEAIRALKERYV